MDFKLNAMDNLDEINEQLKSLDQAEKDLIMKLVFLLNLVLTKVLKY